MLTIRSMQSRDADTIAALHAQSWRSAYRGLLRDDYLAGPIEADRAKVWRERLAADPSTWFGVVAEHAGEPCGFGFAWPSFDPRWGTRIDNLHVRPALKGLGIGRALVIGLCDALLARTLPPPLWLWVYSTNHAARAFYASIGGEEVGQEQQALPGGGEGLAVRCAWPDAAALAARLRAGPR